MANNNRAKRQQRRQDLARRAAPAAPRPTDALGILQQQQVTLSQHWQGPIPPPQDLAEYKAVDAGLPDRILAMAERTLELTEKQTDHRIDMERKSILGMNWRANAGLWLGFIIAMSWFAGSAWLIHDGHALAGTVLGSVDIVAMVSVFVYGRHDQRRQENDRTQS